MTAAAPPSLGTLDGLHAWVTGGANGIGYACVRRLAAAGAVVRVLDRDREAAAAAVETVRRSGGACEAVAIDLARTESLEPIMAELLARDGRVDLLVNAAGVARRSPVATTSLADWNAIVDVNLTAPFLLSRAVAQRMPHGRGRIVHVTSHSAFLGSVGRGAYAAAKAGVVGLTRVLAVELARHGITVNTVAPGPIETAMTARHDDAQRQAWCAAVPMGRYGSADEVAAAIEFLCSREAGYITGQTLCIDGGFTAAGLQV